MSQTTPPQPTTRISTTLLPWPETSSPINPGQQLTPIDPDEVTIDKPNATGSTVVEETESESQPTSNQYIDVVARGTTENSYTFTIIFF